MVVWTLLEDNEQVCVLIPGWLTATVRVPLLVVVLTHPEEAVFNPTSNILVHANCMFLDLYSCGFTSCFDEY